MRRLRVLVTGGSGYLGQHLIVGLLKAGHDVGFTYMSSQLSVPVRAEPFRVDLASGEGLQAAVCGWRPHVIINCAAISQPAACEHDEAACNAVNVPTRLVEELQALRSEPGGHAALLIHISTDQVYDGTRPGWQEEDQTQPVNAYGRSKLAAEQLLAHAWPGRHVVLRCSLIYGPEPPLQSVGRPLFVQFVRAALSSGRATSFFTDEYRSAVFVGDIVAVARALVVSYDASADAAAAAPQPASTLHPSSVASSATASFSGCLLAKLPHFVYNLGGPQRLSRHDMATAVAAHCQLSTDAIRPALSADVARGYNSPADISMCMDRLTDDLPSIQLTAFADGLRQVFPADPK